jgi:hypothetical protein
MINANRYGLVDINDPGESEAVSFCEAEADDRTMVAALTAITAALTPLLGEKGWIRVGAGKIFLSRRERRPDGAPYADGEERDPGAHIEPFELRDSSRGPALGHGLIVRVAGVDYVIAAYAEQVPS